MRFPPALLDDIRARLPVSQVAARHVRLQKRGREYVGLSPFKNEKTPSFTVNDQKQFYHCFSTGEHGDIFKFVMTIEGLGFGEAVERLAEEAGVALPTASPQVIEQEAENDRLRRLVAASQAFFTAQLAAPAGRETRAYVSERGLTTDVVDTFGIGFAPNDRHALTRHLAAQGFSEREIVRAGMAIADDRGGAAYDRFRNRLMFPIRDVRGRPVAFGGRALSSEQKAKYLNSPETPLFHKGHMLFNADQARKAAHSSGEIVVGEGYMDVIALHRAGMAQAVAPLGTALTDDQLKLLWTMADEPILCFDGDAAGRRAAERALELALPHLQPGKSLRFAFLPEGLDPDDLLAQAGPTAVRGVLDKARPLIDVLWKSAWEAGEWTTPERRTALKAILMEKTSRIRHDDLRTGYQRELRDRHWQAFARNGGGRRKGEDRHKAMARGSPQAMTTVRPARRDGNGQAYAGSLVTSAIVSNERLAGAARDALILRALINHPWLLDEYAEEVAELRIAWPQLAVLRDALLDLHSGVDNLDTIDLSDHLARLGQEPALATIGRLTAHEVAGFSHPDASGDVVLTGWHECFTARRCEALDEAIEEARREAERSGESEAYDKVIALRSERDRLNLRTA